MSLCFLIIKINKNINKKINKKINKEINKKINKKTQQNHFSKLIFSMVKLPFQVFLH